VAKDEAWGGEAISQMSQQELKIVPWNTNHGKPCLLQIALFSCCPASPAWGGCRASGAGTVRCDAGAAHRITE